MDFIFSLDLGFFRAMVCPPTRDKRGDSREQAPERAKVRKSPQGHWNGPRKSVAPPKAEDREGGQVPQVSGG